MAGPRSIYIAMRERIRAKRLGMRRRFVARTSRFARNVQGFRSQPEPRSFGVSSRGMLMVGGTYRFYGYTVEAEGTGPWDIDCPDPRFERALHGFGWLDDVMAADTPICRKAAAEWTHEWAARYADGTGAGWEPHITGQRVLTWINHSVTLLKGQPKEVQDAYFTALSRQARFLSKTWHHARPGLDRFQALAGWAFSALALEGWQRGLPKLVRLFGAECDLLIAEDGGIPTRNPEELMEIFSILALVAAGFTEYDLEPDKRHLLALERIAPSLRGLRLGNGALVRFHGGGAGLDGKLDQALMDSGVRLPPRAEGAMGFGRMTSGGITVIADLATAPEFQDAENAHASTLAFEMSSGRYPVVANTGPGHAFGREWRSGARATPAHSTLCVAGVSSSRFSGVDVIGDHFGQKFTEIARVQEVRQDLALDGPRLLAEHDGYLKTHGLIHRRELVLHRDGSKLRGFDVVEARRDSARALFDTKATGKLKKWIAFGLHFHIHPDSEVSEDLGGEAISIQLPNDEIWVFRQEGGKTLLKTSSYMDPLRLKPRQSKQIVVSARAINYEGAITWTLTRSEARRTGS